MTKAERTALSYAAGVKGGRPRLIDREKMLALRAAGKLQREIAEELGVSMASVARILKGVKKG
jgi:transposase